MMDRTIVSGIIFFPGILAALFSLHSVYWFLPLIFISIPIVGFNLRNFFLLDLGVLLSLFSYFFANRGLNPSELTVLLLIIGIFFLFLGIWFYARNMLLLSGIERTPGSEKYIASFKIAAFTEITGDLFIGALLALIASFIGLNSFMGLEMRAEVEMLLFIVLSSSVFLAMYLIVKLFSLEEEEVKTFFDR